MKKLLMAVFAILMIVVAALWFRNSDLEHIEDTNGDDNYTLQTITDENICNLDVGALNVSEHNDLIGDTAVSYTHLTLPTMAVV